MSFYATYAFFCSAMSLFYSICFLKTKQILFITKSRGLLLWIRNRLYTIILLYIKHIWLCTLQMPVNAFYAGMLGKTWISLIDNIMTTCFSVFINCKLKIAPLHSPIKTCAYLFIKGLFARTAILYGNLLCFLSISFWLQYTKSFDIMNIVTSILQTAL